VSDYQKPLKLNIYAMKEAVHTIVIEARKINRIMYPKTNINLTGRKQYKGM
jgi:hypothetical protein